MYKKKKKMWTVTWVLREKKNKQKTGRSSNWRNKKLHELLLVTAGEKLDICSKACSLDFFPLLLLFLCVCVSSFLVCAISMDSSKVDKCRIACSSCLSRGKKPKQNTRTRTHTKLQFPLFENALSTHIRQECFLIFFPPFLWLVFLRVWSETITTDALCSL